MSAWFHYKTLLDPEDEVTSVSFNNEGTLLAAGSINNKVYVFSTDSWEIVTTIEGTASVNAVTFNNEGTLLVFNCDNEAYIYNTNDWTLNETLDDPLDYITSITFNHEDTFLTLSSHDNNVYVYDVDTLELEETLDDANERVSDIVFTNDDSLFASGSLDEKVYIYETEYWTLVKIIKGDVENWVYSVDFSKSDNLLAVGSRNNNVYLYNTDDWSLNRTLTDSNGAIRSVKFNTESSYFVSGSSNGENSKLFVYEYRSWELEKTFGEPTNDITSIDITTNSPYIAVGSTDTNIYIYSFSEKNEKFVSPHYENRYTSIINRFLKFISGGKNVLAKFDEEPFDLNKVSETEVSVGTGYFIKDGILIHVYETQTLDFENTDNYIGDGGLDEEGNYLIVLKYDYSRGVPLERVHLKIIKDKDIYYLFKDSLLFLGVANIIDEYGEFIIDYVDLIDDEVDPPLERSYPKFRPKVIDGGILEDES